MATQATLHLTEAAFDQALAGRAEAVVVDFWAEWCAPCKAIAPILEELAGEYAGRVTIAKVNVDEHPGLAARFQVRSIPTLLFFKGGQVVDQVIGAVPKAQIKKRLDAVA
jgi:thioredoxin 1